MLEIETIKIILVTGLVFWLWMLVDCIRYEAKEWDKILWLCIIVPDRKPPVFGRRHILNFELFLNFRPLKKEIPLFSVNSR